MVETRLLDPRGVGPIRCLSGRAVHGLAGVGRLWGRAAHPEGWFARVVAEGQHQDTGYDEPADQTGGWNSWNGDQAGELQKGRERDPERGNEGGGTEGGFHVVWEKRDRSALRTRLGFPL